ncbi:MFS transporter [Actinokineospora diospyrosa]|uniref:Arabinose efflux permease, MFS family n=1 Tax=Actinokineospora diospyrosa TaxID=103728 RepID=A0ABT1INA6_9PSEU|nr:MFS transporter [Actinokineospora diospyrosa]MCP2274152.1 putative arabinose efflux permease, MFS family [Actinokineospora diospyrosa]
MTSATPAAAASPRASAQRRVLTVLVVAQILSGAGLAAGVTVGALLAQHMLGSTNLAGLPTTLATAGSALAAISIGRVSHARGRRPGLAIGYLTGAIGSAGVIIAAALSNPVLLFIALFVYGAGTATNMQARYAGADLADPAHRGRAVSTVLVATTLGGVAGPNLAAPTGHLALAVGLPELAGVFMLSGIAYALAALVLAVWLRPDPLLLARAEALPESAAQPRTEPGPRYRSGPLPGALIMVLTQLVMVAIMTMTPVHMSDHGHGTAAAGLVIAIHIGAMYLPSPLTGWLVDRYGRITLAVGAGATLLAAGIIAATAPGDSVPLLALALALLGLGWNFGLVSGTAIITDAVPLATRAKTQGTIDVSVAIAGASGGLASGVVVGTVGYPVLALACGILALAILPAVAAIKPN